MVKFIKNEEDLQRIGTHNREKLEKVRDMIYQRVEDYIASLPPDFREKINDCEIVLDFKEDQNGEIKVDPVTVNVYKTDNQSKKELEYVLFRFLETI